MRRNRASYHRTIAVKRSVRLVLVLMLCTPLVAFAQAGDSAPVRSSHGFTLFGQLKYGPDVTHFDYTNPDAPKGGSFRYAFGSSFDNLNPFIVSGNAPSDIAAILYDPLMRRSGDEPASVYGVIAEMVTWPDDYAWAEFTLQEGARFHDGEPITPEDVMFSLETLREKGTPEYRSNYADVANIEKTGPRRVRFTFAAPGDRGNVYTVAQLYVFPAHYWSERDFSAASIEAPTGSGPYRVAEIDPGRSVIYERVRDYWAADLPVNRGRYNFDTIRHDYFRDISIVQEALLAGNYDLRWETLPSQWATGYDIPAVHEGRLIKESLPYSGPTMYSGYFFNLRKTKFQDRRVREAIAHAFDFEWTNRMIFYGQYIRMTSHFENSELAADGLPGKAELALLEPWRDQLPESVFTEPYEPPTTDGTRASLRENLREASRLLAEAGWTLQDGTLVNADGEPMTFELVSWDPFFERVNAPFIANLELLGIEARQRTIDTAQWFNRLQNFDFDITLAFYFPQSMSPGAEQRNYWGSESANRPGASNYPGISNPVVDAMIEHIIKAPDRASRVAATRALDRVLLWNFYSVPHYYAPGIPIVYWNKFGRPDRQPTWLQILWHMPNWWVDPDKEAALERARNDGD